MQLHYCCTTTTTTTTTTTATTTTTTIYDADDHGTLPDLSKDWFIGYSSIRLMMMMMMMMMMILISSTTIHDVDDDDVSMNISIHYPTTTEYY